MKLSHYISAILMIFVGGILIPSTATAFDLPLKNLIDRAIEARSFGDIAKDNEIVVKINAIMLTVGTIDASTEIYEQRLLITGIFDDKKLYDEFERKVRDIYGIKKLYWHVLYIPKGDVRNNSLLDWTTVLGMGTKATARLISTAGVADVNFRTAVDSMGIIYIIGRARSHEEARKAVAVARDGYEIKKLVDYIEVRP